MWWLFGGVLALTPGFKHVRTDRLEFDVLRDMAHARVDPHMLHEMATHPFGAAWGETFTYQSFQILSADFWQNDDQLVLALTVKSPSSWPFGHFFDTVKHPVQFRSFGDRVAMVVGANMQPRIVMSLRGGLIDVVIHRCERSGLSAGLPLFSHLLQTLRFKDNQPGG